MPRSQQGRAGNDKEAPTEARRGRRAAQEALPRLSKKACSTAKKLLQDYARIYEKAVRKPMPRKLKEKLDRKRKAKTITSGDLPKTC